MPTWPRSPNLAIVCVEEKENKRLDFQVVCSAGELDRMVDPQYGPQRLYFLVPKKVLMEYVDGLEPESFQA
jgi:hypothetical protein